MDSSDGILKTYPPSTVEKTMKALKSRGIKVLHKIRVKKVLIFLLGFCEVF